MELHVSLIQSDIVWENASENLSHFEKLISSVPRQSDIIVLPEMFSTAFSMNPDKIAVELESDLIQWIKDQAVNSNNALIAGFASKQEVDGHMKNFNTLIFAQPDGKVQIYNKRHLFRMAGENIHYTSGLEKVIIEYKGWRIRPFICYDLRFPVWCRNVVKQNGKPEYDYDCAIFIANWPESRRLHWSTLLKARAIENQAYVVGVNRIGTDAKGFSYSGDSVAISPLGEELTHIAPHAEGVETIALNRNTLNNYRQKFPFILDADLFDIHLE